MVARGDLGVEIPAYRVPAIQANCKKICSKSKAVIIATQMLESMTHNLLQLERRLMM